MSLICIDFETRSNIDINTKGAVHYTNGSEADILFLNYKIDDQQTKQWHTGEPIPEFIQKHNDHTIYAFNALFEYRIWNTIGVKKYNFDPINLSSFIDVQAICGRFTFFQSLEKAGKVLNLKLQKLKSGKNLIKKICCPPYIYTSAEYSEFKYYGLIDVDTMYEMLHTLPATKLSAQEQKAWILTQEINLRGIPIDIQAVHQILKVTEAYKLEQSLVLPTLTKGNVTKATQTQRIVNWLNKNGLKIPNLQAATVEKYLAKADLSENAKLLLQLRQDLGKTSTAKYQKLKDQTYKGRIYDNLRYYGTNTGRWAGMGFQLLNLPRSKVTDAQSIIDSFMDLSAIENGPIQLAKDVVRGMICAPEGKLIMFIDYSAIEYVVLSWTVNDERTLKLFRKGYDQYVDMASFVFSVDYDNVTKDQRDIGKMLILGCGYGLGAIGFQKNAAARGVILSLSEATDFVNGYREMYSRVKNYWYLCKNMAINAISFPGTEFIALRCKFKVVLSKHGGRWLRLDLPSGRALYYNTPIIEEGKFGPEATAMGIHPYTKKWARLSIIPGRFVENIIQALSRDILVEGKFKLRDAGYEIIGSIYDEVMMEIDERNAEGQLKEACKLMCETSEWRRDLPLKAEGVTEKRYRKM